MCCLDSRTAICVNAVAPAGIDTPLLAGFRSESNDADTSGWSRGRPEDVADLVLFLASDESPHIFGTHLIDNRSTDR